jgi:chemotaxis receptor (MCP) glutamine deamidase CheD
MRASIMLTKIGAMSITKKKNNVVSGILGSCE